MFYGNEKNSDREIQRCEFEVANFEQLGILMNKAKAFLRLFLIRSRNMRLYFL